VENLAISGITPTIVFSPVRGGRGNRTREYLTETEIERLMAAARKGAGTVIATPP